MIDLDVMRQYREESFGVAVEPIAHPYLYADKLILSVTQNGYQWNSFALTPDEARKVIDALNSYLESK